MQSLFLLFENWTGLVSGLLVVSSLIFVGALTIFYNRATSAKKLPPINKEGIIETVSALSSNKLPLFLHDKAKEMGPVYRLNLPNTFFYFICCDPTLARSVFEQHDEKPYQYHVFSGATIVHSIFSKRTHDEGWSIARKGVAKSFSMSNLSLALPKLYGKLAELFVVLDKVAANSEVFDVHRVGVDLTLDFLGLAMLGLDFKTILPDNQDANAKLFQSNMDETMREFAQRRFANPIRHLMFWDPKLYEGLKARDAFIAFGMKLMREYRAARTPEDIENDMSIMGHLMRSPYPTEQDRLADFLVFLVGGHDTTGHSLAFIIVEVARHPEVYRKLKAEMDATVGSDVQFIDPNNAAKLTYLDMVIKEGMRLWPVAAGGSLRELSSDVKYGEYVLPKGSTVQIPFYALFRTGIEQPDEFVPERWSEGAAELAKLKELFSPFALGVRNCVGQNLAMLELKLVLANLFRSYKFTYIGDEVKFDYFLTLKPIDAHVRVERV